MDNNVRLLYDHHLAIMVITAKPIELFVIGVLEILEHSDHDLLAQYWGCSGFLRRLMKKEGLKKGKWLISYPFNMKQPIFSMFHSKSLESLSG